MEPPDAGESGHAYLQLCSNHQLPGESEVALSLASCPDHLAEWNGCPLPHFSLVRALPEEEGKRLEAEQALFALALWH